MVADRSRSWRLGRYDAARATYERFIDPARGLYTDWFIDVEMNPAEGSLGRGMFAAGHHLPVVHFLGHLVALGGHQQQQQQQQNGAVADSDGVAEKTRNGKATVAAYVLVTLCRNTETVAECPGGEARHAQSAPLAFEGSEPPPPPYGGVCGSREAADSEASQLRSLAASFPSCGECRPLGNINQGGDANKPRRDMDTESYEDNADAVDLFAGVRSRFADDALHPITALYRRRYLERLRQDRFAPWAVISEDAFDGRPLAHMLPERADDDDDDNSNNDADNSDGETLQVAMFHQALAWLLGRFDSIAERFAPRRELGQRNL
jgi:hypothetical protein